MTRSPLNYTVLTALISISLVGCKASSRSVIVSPDRSSAVANLETSSDKVEPAVSPTESVVSAESALYTAPVASEDSDPMDVTINLRPRSKSSDTHR